MDAKSYDLNIQYKHAETNAYIHVWLTRQAARDVIYSLMQQMFEPDQDEFQVTLAGALTEDENDRVGGVK